MQYTLQRRIAYTIYDLIGERVIEIYISNLLNNPTKTKQGEKYFNRYFPGRVVLNSGKKKDSGYIILQYREPELRVIALFGRLLF